MSENKTDGMERSEVEICGDGKESESIQYDTTIFTCGLRRYTRKKNHALCQLGNTNGKTKKDTKVTSEVGRCVDVEESESTLYDVSTFSFCVAEVY